MSEDEKKKIAQRLSTRVATGIMFVEIDYLPRYKTPDSAWIRNIYILLSFYTELLLKAIFVIKGDFANIDELEKHLMKMGHDLESIGREIGNDNLMKFEIKRIKCIQPDYLIETESGDFSVKNFIDIRYDFIEGKIRTLKGDEHEMFDKQIKIMHKINNILKPLIW